MLLMVKKRFKPASYPITINGHELELPVRSSNATLIDGIYLGVATRLAKIFLIQSHFMMIS